MATYTLEPIEHDYGGRIFVPVNPLETGIPGEELECPLCGALVYTWGGGDGEDWRGNYGAIPEQGQCENCEAYWVEW